ncbi:MAG: UvrB/UvrC motif-containing protein [Firmicutes bacterium]|nr:UvrB/UvrC motif-containing protein [Bacillota bacterium]
MDTPGGVQAPVCQRCLKRPATVQFSKVVNGEKSERLLCEECAREEGAFHFMLGPVFTVQNVLGGLIGQVPGPVRPSFQERRCPHCGYTYQRFAETGRLGCDRCYETFADQLEPLIRRIQGRASHHGKVPGRAGRAYLRQREIARMKAELKAAVEREEFERAAELRDQIRRLEDELRSSDVGEGGAVR